MRKNVASDYLRRILDATKLTGVPSIEEEVTNLVGRLTVAELAAVARLLERALTMTHHVYHLPSQLGLEAVGEWTSPLPENMVHILYFRLGNDRHECLAGVFNSHMEAWEARDKLIEDSDGLYSDRDYNIIPMTVKQTGPVAKDHIVEVWNGEGCQVHYQGPYTKTEAEAVARRLDARFAKENSRKCAEAIQLLKEVE